MTVSSPSMLKADLRRAMQQRRAEAFIENPRASHMMRDLFLATTKLPPGAVVAGSSARGSEIDPAPLLDALRAQGHVIVLPVMRGRDRPLIFRRHDPALPLIANSFGIQEPPASAQVLEPDVVLVPLLAFDARRNRLGTGGGYYDRTLADVRRRKQIMTIGMGFQMQQCPEIPTESHDVPLDRIITELQVFGPSAP